MARPTKAQMKLTKKVVLPKKKMTNNVVLPPRVEKAFDAPEGRTTKGKPQDQTAKKVKKALNGERGGLAPLLRTGDWERARNGTLETKLANSPARVSEQEKQLMINDRLAGASQRDVAEKYGVSERYIDMAMKKKYVTTADGRKVLESALLENAIVANMHFRDKVGELSGMQAAVATGIMTGKFIDLQKHAGETPVEVDLSALSAMGDMLKDIRASVGDDVTDVIEAEATSERID